MKRSVRLGTVVMCVLLLASSSWAQGPCLPPGPFRGPDCTPPWMVPPLAPETKPPEKAPPTPERRAAEQPPEPETTPQPETGERGVEEAYDGPMFGDIVVPVASFQSSVSPGVLALLATSVHAPPTAPQAIIRGSAAGGATFPFHTAFKISENELPRPLDRLFVTYNYYSDVAASGLAFGAPGAQVHREMTGGEKTFLGGNASVGIRVPVFWTFGSTSVVDSQLGDISLVFKYAFVNNRRTGDTLSAGMVVSLPTGPSLTVPGQSSVNSTVLQPWVGGIWHWGNLYSINFTSLAVPTDARDVTLFFESFSLAYRVYRSNDPDRWLRGIVPDAEFHANIPLNHESLTSIPIGFPNTVDFTGGCYFFLRRAVLGMAAGTPLTGPRPFGFEALATLNYIF